MLYLWAIIATLCVSLISLVGIFTLSFKKKNLDRILVLFIGFAAGGLMGGAFLHLLPEALEHSKNSVVFLFCLAGFIFFFILERYFHWRHCHNGVCDVHAFTYLNLIGDGIHNFGDGLVIGVSFLVDARFGIITTLAVIFHEVPQEMGDFAVLVYGGFSKAKALFFNFISATTAIIGAILGCYFGTRTDNFSTLLIPFTAGGFIYIAASDLIPELHKQIDIRRANLSFIMFILGILFLWWVKLLFH